jgi:hypothetical protein
VRKFAARSASVDEGLIDLAKSYRLGTSKDEVLDRLFGLRSIALPRKRLEEAYELAERHSDTDGDPKMAWGFSAGLTRASQGVSYTDERVALDRAAGRVLNLAVN